VVIIAALSIVGLISLALATRAAMRRAPIAEIGSRQ
jgi:hypothetical protein